MQNYSNTGIEFDSSKAPWNQKDQKELEFQCLCSQTLSKTVPVFTNDYSLLYEEEVNNVETGNTDWAEAYHDNDHYTPVQLIALFRDTLKKQLETWKNVENTSVGRAHIGRINHLIEECEDWVEDETVYQED